jgi:hypothetical protein
VTDLSNEVVTHDKARQWVSELTTDRPSWHRDLTVYIDQREAADRVATSTRDLSNSRKDLLKQVDAILHDAGLVSPIGHEIAERLRDLVSDRDELRSKLELAQAKQRSAELGLELFQQSAAVVEERCTELRDVFGQIADAVNENCDDLEPRDLLQLVVALETERDMLRTESALHGNIMQHLEDLLWGFRDSEIGEERPKAKTWLEHADEVDRILNDRKALRAELDQVKEKLDLTEGMCAREIKAANAHYAVSKAMRTENQQLIKQRDNYWRLLCEKPLGSSKQPTEAAPVPGCLTQGCIYMGGHNGPCFKRGDVVPTVVYVGPSPAERPPSCRHVRPPQPSHADPHCVLPTGHDGDHAAMSVDDAPAGPRWAAVEPNPEPAGRWGSVGTESARCNWVSGYGVRCALPHTHNGANATAPQPPTAQRAEDFVTRAELAAIMQESVATAGGANIKLGDILTYQGQRSRVIGTEGYEGATKRACIEPAPFTGWVSVDEFERRQP